MHLSHHTYSKSIETTMDLQVNAYHPFWSLTDQHGQCKCNSPAKLYLRPLWLMTTTCCSQDIAKKTLLCPLRGDKLDIFGLIIWGLQFAVGRSPLRSQHVYQGTWCHPGKRFVLIHWWQGHTKGLPINSCHSWHIVFPIMVILHYFTEHIQ